MQLLVSLELLWRYCGRKLMGIDVKEKNLAYCTWKKKKDGLSPREENYDLEDQKSPLALKQASYVTPTFHNSFPVSLIEILQLPLLHPLGEGMTSFGHSYRTAMSYITKSITNHLIHQIKFFGQFSVV